MLTSPAAASTFDFKQWQKPVPARVRSKLTVESSNGARLCLKGQSQQLRHSGHVRMNSSPLGLRTCCGWVFDHSRAPYRRFGSHLSCMSWLLQQAELV